MAWTWFRTKAPAPVPSDGLDRYTRRPLFGAFHDGYNVFGPYRRPIQDATGHGGQLVQRQLNPYSPNYVVPQQWTPVSIAGNGSELTGTYAGVGLIDTSGQNNSANVLIAIVQPNNVNRVN